MERDRRGKGKGKRKGKERERERERKEKGKGKRKGKEGERERERKGEGRRKECKGKDVRNGGKGVEGGEMTDSFAHPFMTMFKLPCQIARLPRHHFLVRPCCSHSWWLQLAHDRG